MKRDDVDLSAPAGVARTPLWFSAASVEECRGEPCLFGWLHAPAAIEPSDLVAVICPPGAHEYTRAHRTLRHLADRLARAGIPALRFDCHGQGDSAGSDLDPVRVAAWQGSIRAAIAEARRLTGRQRVCLIGVRLGATLAALVAQDEPVDTLVLWNPVVKGRAYVRELQAIARMAAQVAGEPAGGLEAAGFAATAETLASLRAIDLATAAPRAARVLVLHRDDVAAEPALPFATETLRVPGWAGMMAEHQFTVVPDAALDTLVARLVESRGRSPVPTAPKPGSVPGFPEVLCRFGAEGELFGILSGPGAPRERPAILLFNAGSVHHVGPNRIYVTLARHFAELGFASLRFDLQGIGDSPLRVEGRENHPYPAHAQDDVRAAIHYLRREHGFRRFIAMGLCSGAHTAFHAGLATDIEGIEEIVLINPLTFEYVEGMSLETVTQFSDAQQYRKSMKDPARWLKLLRGDVNFRRLFEVALGHPKTLARSYYHAFCERALPARAPKLSQDLRRLFALGRRVTLLVAEGDPGRDILMAGARHTATRALRDGRLRLEMIPGGDHTFSQARPRRELIERLTAHLEKHAGAGAAG